MEDWFAPDVIFHRMTESLKDIMEKRQEPEAVLCRKITKRYLWMRARAMKSKLREVLHRPGEKARGPCRRCFEVVRHMSQAPLVSIIVGVYNCEQLLPATLRSIQDQSWQDWECILVDDGSTDRTPEIAREYAGQDPRFRAITQKNTGTCGARNRVYAESNPGSRYVTFMDHDDVWLPGALNSLVASAEANPALAGAHGLSDYIDEKGAPLLPGKFASHGRERIGLGEDGRMKEWDFTKPTSFRMLLMRNTVFPPGVLLTRRAFYEKAGLFDPAMALVEDWDLLLRLSPVRRFCLPERGCGLLQEAPEQSVQPKRRTQQTEDSPAPGEELPLAGQYTGAG